jgi:UDP-N-acetylglucosamine diphosphorylase/glucosamine-1-phosphate N-acetyltransferase
MPSAVPVILFDDDSPWLSPLTDLRASFLVRTGAMTTLERWVAIAPSMGMEVAGVRASARLDALTRESVSLPVMGADVAAGLPSGEVLFVNGRCVLSSEAIARLGAGAALAVPAAAGGAAATVIAARLGAADARAFAESLVLPAHVRTVAATADDAKMLHRPWDVVRHRDACLDADLAFLAGLKSTDLRTSRWHSASDLARLRGVTLVNEGAVFVHPTAKISPSVVLDAEGGPIVVDEGAVVRPGVIIVGPASIGKGSSVLERGFIKAHTAIGPVCKVTGEIGGTIFQGYANKGHEGHLGDSWVGEWANFGAGTTNSNLLNTYAEVIATSLMKGASKERTGIQYLGCIVGDHTKFAINTRIMTGSVFGTGCMVATTAAPPTCVPAYSWLTDERTQVYRFSKFLEVAKTVMGRRKIVPSAAYVAAMESHGKPE